MWRLIETIITQIVAIFVWTHLDRIFRKIWPILIWPISLLNRHKQIKKRLQKAEETLTIICGLDPELSFLKDIRSDDKATIVRGLSSLTKIVTNLSDTKAASLLFEVTKLDLTESPNEEVRREVFRLRGRTASCTPESYPSVWVTLLSSLELLLKSNIPDVQYAAILELCEHSRRVAECIGCGDIQERIHMLLLSQFERHAEFSNEALRELIESVASLGKVADRLKQAFSKAIYIALSNPIIFGNSLIKMLSELQNLVFYLDHEHLNQMMKSDELFDLFEVNFNNHLTNTVFQNFNRDHKNGRVWKRVSVSGQASCEVLNGVINERCKCNIPEVSLRGFWSPTCNKPFGASLGRVELTLPGEEKADPVLVRAAVCTVVDSHSLSQQKGRGLLINNMSREETLKLFNYISKIA